MAVIATAITVFFHVRIFASLPPIDEPLRVRFTLADGVRVSGEMTSCDENGFDGTFGRREWVHLQYEDAWKLHQRVMDSSDARDWLNLGRVMLLITDAQPLAAQRAETALKRARQIDESMEPEIEQLREDVARIHRERREAAREAESQRLTTLSPESGPTMRSGGHPWPATPWPAIGEPERAAAVQTMQADAQAILKQVGAAAEPAETTHFIIYSDLDRKEVADIAVRLERIVAGVHFGLNPGFDPHASDRPHVIVPWGKIVVLVWKQHDQFKISEAGSFNHLVPNATVAIAHYAGQRTFINAWRCDDRERFEASMAVAVVHAMMHNFKTPRRLPAWANHGLAEMIASRAGKASHHVRERRRLATEFIRAGGSVRTIMAMKYEDGSFPGPDEIGASMGGIIVELMMNEKPVAFVKWILAVKSGKDWQEALNDEYGSTGQSIAEVTAQYYMVND